MSPEQIQTAIDEARRLKVDAKSLRAKGEFSSSLKHFADAHDIAAELAGLPKNNRSDEIRLLLAECETGFGYTLHKEARCKEAIQRFHRAVSIRAYLAHNDFEDPNLLAHRALVHHHVGKAHNEDPQVNILDAFSNCEAAFQQFVKVLEIDPPDDHRRYVNQFLRAANLYVHCLSLKGRHEQALAVCDVALAIATKHQRFLKCVEEVGLLRARRVAAKECRTYRGRFNFSWFALLLLRIGVFVRYLNWMSLTGHAIARRLDVAIQTIAGICEATINAAENRTRNYITNLELLTQQTLRTCLNAFDAVCDVVAEAVNLSARQRAGPSSGRFERPMSNFSLPGSGVRPWRPLLARGDGLPA